MSSSEFQLLVISLGPDDDRCLINDDWASLTQDLAARCPLDWATSVREVDAKLGTSSPFGVLVLDAGFQHKNRHLNTVVALLVEYAERGGTVVFSGVFPAVVKPSPFNTIFRSFGVDWKFGEYDLVKRSSFNPQAKVAARYLAHQVPYMPSGCELSQLSARVPTEADVLYKFDLPRGHLESAVTMARVGRGHVAFVGDRENAATTRTTILAMFRLLP